MNDNVDLPLRQSDSASPAPLAEPPGKKTGGISPWAIIAVLALGLAGWQWMETRTRLAETQQELAKRLAESDAVAQESRALAKQAWPPWRSVSRPLTCRNSNDAIAR